MNKIPSLSVPALLKQHGLRADKKLGQNFLQDADALKEIAEAAMLRKSDSVLEIGPGLGSLTRHLAMRAGEVTAVELDTRLIPILHSALKSQQNIHVVEGDILQLSPAQLGLHPGYIVAANIPYNITSALIRHLLESRPRPRRIVLTIQKEVAERICASPPDMSLLALSVQVYGKPEITNRIPASAFFPQPKVDSAVVRIEIHPEPLMPEALLPVFFRIIKAGFSQKRKTLRNALSAGLKTTAGEAAGRLSAAGIDLQRRAETLKLAEWKTLCEIYAAK